MTDAELPNGAVPGTVCRNGEELSVVISIDGMRVKYLNAARLPEKVRKDLLSDLRRYEASPAARASAAIRYAVEEEDAVRKSGTDMYAARWKPVVVGKEGT